MTLFIKQTGLKSSLDLPRTVPSPRSSHQVKATPKNAPSDRRLVQCHQATLNKSTIKTNYHKFLKGILTQDEFHTLSHTEKSMKPNGSPGRREKRRETPPSTDRRKEPSGSSKHKRGHYSPVLL